MKQNNNEIDIQTACDRSSYFVTKICGKKKRVLPFFFCLLDAKTECYVVCSAKLYIRLLGGIDNGAKR